MSIAFNVSASPAAPWSNAAQSVTFTVSSNPALPTGSSFFFWMQNETTASNEAQFSQKSTNQSSNFPVSLPANSTGSPITWGVHAAIYNGTTVVAHTDIDMTQNA